MSTSPDYFSRRPDRVLALRAACESWRDTPFRERSAVKGAGGGVDCAGFVGAVLYECGAIEGRIAIPPYEVNHAEHSSESVLRAWFERPEVRARVRRVDESEPHLDGDIVFPKVGRTEHHLGIRIGQLVYHVVRPAGWSGMTVAQLPLAPSRYRLTA
jgi:cell wall-associated NlpC family hydrolase